MAQQLSEMTGKLVMVTGATNGIGKATAHRLAQLGAAVIIVGRNPQKCQDVVRELQADTGNRHIEYMVADLSLQKAVHNLAEQFKAKHDRLDVLINNAGTVYQQREVTAEGFEKSWALNHLNYFLLTHCLLDHLKTPSRARIINVASSGHKWGGLDFDDLQAEKRYNGFRQYNNTKLANILFTIELARRLEGTGVTANSVHPGLVTSSFPPADDLPGKILLGVLGLFSKTAAQGAETSVYLAASPEVEGMSGGYFVNCRPATPSKLARDAQLAQRLWQVSLQQIGAIAHA